MPKYDLAVVGAGLGGLAVAALAARRGRKVVVLEPGEAAGGVLKVRREGDFVFSPGPHLSFGFERFGTIYRLGEHLGIALHAFQYSPCYQVALPDRRITVYAELGETLDELHREFPREIDRIAQFYRDIRILSDKAAKSRLSSFIAKKRNAGAFIRRYRFSREFEIFLDIQARVFFRRKAMDLPLASLLTICDAPPVTLPDGFKGIIDQLVDVILKQGGEIRYQAPVSDVSMKKGWPTALSTPQGPLDAQTVLFNTEYPETKRDVTLFIGSHVTAMPVGMLHNVLCLPDYEKPDYYFTISVSEKDNELAAPRGMAAITATFPADSAGRTTDDMMELVCRIMPFLSEFVVVKGMHTAAQRPYEPTAGTVLKSVCVPNCQAQLGRLSSGNTYLLGDGSGTPAQEIAAALAATERMK